MIGLNAFYMNAGFSPVANRTDGYQGAGTNGYFATGADAGYTLGLAAYAIPANTVYIALQLQIKADSGSLTAVVDASQASLRKVV